MSIATMQSIASVGDRTKPSERIVSTRNVVEKETELDANKRLALEIRTQIEVSSVEERKKRLNDVYKKWVIESKPQTNSIFSTLERALQNYGLTAEGLRIGHFEKATKLVLFEITYLYLFMSQKNSVEDQQEDTELVEEDSEYKEIKMKFNKIFSTITDAENAVRNSLFLQNSMMEEEFNISENDNGLYRFTPIDYSTNSPYQNLLLYLLERLMKKGYRRYNDECYKPIYTESGFNTHAWECAMSVRSFIHEVTKKEINFNMWKNLTSSKDNVKSAEKYLTEYIGGEFEDLTKDRHVFSFRNGIYLIKKSQVVQKITDDGRTEEEFYWYDEFIPFEGPKAKAIGASVVAAKYFDLDFNDCTDMTKKYDWFNIIREHCPNFKGIMDYQEWPEETQKWLCILIGRNMYNLGELEEWQILGYLLGQGGSGKCFLKDTPIMLFDGSIRPVQDIKVGDFLMGDDSKPREVKVLSNGIGQMYRVKQVNGDDYVVNQNHVLSLKVGYVNKGNDYRHINGKKYSQGDIIDIPIMEYMKLSNSQKKSLVGFKVGIEFPDKEVPIDPYLLGLWLGDGTSASPIITNQDTAVVHYLANKLPEYECFIEYQMNRRKDNHYSYKMATIYKGNNNNYVWESIKGLNLQNNKHIPEIYKINSREKRLSLLAGLLDTDGSLGTGVFDLIQKNKKLAEDIQYLIRSLGFYTKIQECKKGCMWKGEYREGTYYRMCISGNLDEIPTRIPRKKASKRLQKKNVLHTGVTVELAQIDEYFGFEVDGNHRFLMGDTTVTHNSTILTKVVKQIYETCDIGVLSNNIERKFGLSALADKFMFIGPEIKGDLSMEQSEFQSIISGEDVQVAEKHKIAKSIVWTVPGMLSGNEVPQYSDNAGSISRRLMVFKFDNKVKKGDTTLGHKLKAEMPYIIQAAAKGYLDAVNRYGSADIWDIVPEYFKKTKDDMAENTNALMHFLKSDAVRISPKCYVRSKVFVSAFNDHCKENNLGTVKWCNDYYLGPFSCFGIKTQRDCRRRYPNVAGARSYHGVFIFGVDIASDFDPGDEEDGGNNDGAESVSNGRVYNDPEEEAA